MTEIKNSQSGRVVVVHRYCKTHLYSTVIVVPVQCTVLLRTSQW